MSADLRIGNGHVVSIHYTLTDGTGQILDSSRSTSPLEYLHGFNNIVPGLEAQLTGKTVGDRFMATVAPADGYGEYKQPGPQPLPRDSFPAESDLREGVQFTVQADNGETFPVWIKRVDNDTVYVDANHPLAGVTLNFDVEVFSIRDATDKEQAQGSPDRETALP